MPSQLSMQRLSKRIPSFLTPARVLWSFLIAFGLALLAREVFAPQLLGRVIPEDFEVVVLARDRIAAGIDPYIPNEKWPYKYSPFAALAYGILPKDHHQSWLAFVALMITGWVVAVGLGAGKATWKKFGLVALGVILSFKGVGETLFWGQLDFIFLIFGIFAAICFKRWPLTSGVLLGMLPWLKLPWGFIWLPFLVEAFRRDRKVFGQLMIGLTASTLFCTTLLPVAMVGWSRALQLMASWYELIRTQPAVLFVDPWNQSLWPSLIRWFGEAGKTSWLKGLMLAGAGLVTWTLLKSRLHKRTPSEALAWLTPWLVLTQLLNPLGWSWGGNLLIVGAPLAFESAAWSRRKIIRWPLIAVATICFVSQLSKVTMLLGFKEWTDLFSYGNVTAYWLSLLGLML